MKRLLSIVLAFSFAACGTTNSDDQGNEPDAGVSCCSLYPDVNAINACVALAPGACGHLRCELGAGSAVDVAVCGPARTDGGSQ